MKPVRERRIAETVAGSGGGGGGVRGLGGGGGLTVLNGDVCEAGAGLREAERGVWGWMRRWRREGGREGCPERSEVQCCRAALGSLND